MNYRDVAAMLFRRKVKVFESINNSVEFAEDRDVVLASSPEFATRMALHEHVSRLVADRAIAYLEFGVWKGESFGKWLSLNAHPDSRFTGFDTFTGLPEDWTPTDPKGTFSTEGRAPVINDSRGRFVSGLFQETLYQYLSATPPAGQLVVHVDCDLYSSTLFVLAVLDRHFSPGSLVIFDDFHSLNHEFAAWRDYRRAFSQRWMPIGKTRNCLQAAFQVRLAS